MTYEILSDNMERLRKRLATIEKKCRKAGAEFSFEETGETFRKVVDPDTNVSHTAKFITVEVSGRMQHEGWEFVATIEHRSPMNVVRTIGDCTVPERYYTAKTFCEHCRTNRARKDTYLIRNTETGEYKQVGKKCLAEYTNGLSAEAVAAYIAWFDAVIRGNAPTGGFAHYYNVEEVLRNAVEAVRMYGYVKSDSRDAIPTKGVVAEQILRVGKWHNRVEDGFDASRDDVEERAKQIMAYFSALEEDYSYVTNVKALLNCRYCEYRDFGLIASAVPSYRKAMEKEERRKAEQEKHALSDWIGKIGDRISLTDVLPECLTSWQTDFGMTYVYKFLVGDNVLVWKTGTWLNGKCSLKGTIKNHSLYNGVKQTELTRCRITA